jgi:hypothetical protein
MFRRRATLFLIAVAMVLIGGKLFLYPFHNEPLWTEWLLAPILLFLGILLAIVGAAIHFFRETLR